MMWSTPRLRNNQVSSRSAVLEGIGEKREIIAEAVAMMVGYEMGCDALCSN